MPGAQINFEFQDQEFRGALANLRLTPERLRGITRAIGTGMLHNTQARFRSGHGPDGTAWKPLSPAYAAIKRGHNILVASGRLQDSISMRTRGAEITVGSNTIYAGVHQFGAVIRPKKPNGRLRFVLGGRVVFARSVTIPARPYLGFGPEDEEVVMDALDVLLPGGR